MPFQQTKRPLRILGSSGSAQDRRRLVAAAVKNHKNDPFDVLVGDWMSEANMTFNATKHHKGEGIAYEKTFISALEDVLPEIAEHGIKIAANAGSSDTKGLYDALLALVKEKNDLERRGWENLGLPIAEIDHSGQVIITKTRGSNGLVSVNTCKSQLLYEIQGPRYYNSDVTAYLEGVKFEELGPDRVLLSGIHGGPPPATTKVGITGKEAYHAEMVFWLVGLDIETKARMLEAQIREELGNRVKNLSLLEFTLNGVAAEDAQDQASATVGFRVVAQSLENEYLSPPNFLEPILETTMEFYPGGTFHMDVRTALPREVHEYFVTKFPQSRISHCWIVHSRSGYKGSNANVGFYIRHDDEYEWLRALLTVEKIQQLLAKEYNGGRIERLELPNIGAVHFLLYDHLDRGVSCTTTLNFLGKNVGEYLRSKFVDIPVAFLDSGKI
ncbi:Protein of unknown function DUF1446 [Penicillium cf. viridicatum]|uniref:Uncharacterized protein n=1 Tax=Penicillium cf. viridicatum TaxID=2972119 RepID=A0A9W9IWJ3_9EURO|nr:Protein of unknown function DUF1446 [Penicillium cf. viridicatum]